MMLQALLVTGKERQVGGAMLYKLSETPQYFPAALVFARHPGGASLEAPLNEVAAPLSVGDRLIYRGLAYYGYIATVTAINVEDGVANSAVCIPFAIVMQMERHRT